MYSYIFFLVIFSIGYVDSHCQPPSQRSVEAKLREQIFCNYNKTVRPTKDYANATNVYMLLYPRKIYMDHFDETLNVHAHVFYAWRDQLISWIPKDYESIDFLTASNQEIWLPDIVVDSASQLMESNHLTNFYSVLSYTGEIYGFSVIDIITHCTADLTKFPYDTQNCTFSVSSMGYSVNDVNLLMIDHNHGIAMARYMPNKVWEIVAFSNERVERNFPWNKNGNSSYPSITFNFILQRHSSIHQSVVIVPAIGLALITLLTFLMHSMHNNRIILCSVAIIGDILYLTFLGFWLPSNGDQSPVIITFFRDSLLISTLALLTVILVHFLSSKTDVPSSRITGLISKLESSILSNIFLGDSTPKEDDTVGIMESQKENKATTWIQFAFFIDRVSFIACILLYIVLSTFYIP